MAACHPAAWGLWPVGQLPAWPSDISTAMCFTWWPGLHLWHPTVPQKFPQTSKRHPCSPDLPLVMLRPGVSQVPAWLSGLHLGNSTGSHLVLGDIIAEDTLVPRKTIELSSNIVMISLWILYYSHPCLCKVLKVPKQNQNNTQPILGTPDRQLWWPLIQSKSWHLCLAL